MGNQVQILCNGHQIPVRLGGLASLLTPYIPRWVCSSLAPRQSGLRDWQQNANLSYFCVGPKVDTDRIVLMDFQNGPAL